MGKEVRDERISRKFLVDDKSNGLYVYEMPTGSGKTYKAAKFIHDFLIDNYADSKIKRVFYLTPQRKNVKGSINEVEKIFVADKKGWTNAINNSILHIQANASSVLEHLLDYNGEDEFTKTDEYRDLKGESLVLMKLKILVVMEQQA